MNRGVYFVQVTDTAVFDVGVFSLFILFFTGVAVLASKLEDPSQRRLLNIENLLTKQVLENQDMIKAVNETRESTKEILLKLDQSNQRIIKLLS